MNRQEFLVKIKAYEITREQLIKYIGDLYEDNQALSTYIERIENEKHI